jgi:hypothetical protein
MRRFSPLFALHPDTAIRVHFLWERSTAVNHDGQDERQQQGVDITVYKIVSVIDGQRQSVAMEGCAAIYVPGQMTYPPLPNSPLFAYRTLEDAQQEYERLVEINAWRLAIPPMQVWKAVTSREVVGPKRIPSAGVYYVGLLRKCGYGARLSDTYRYFWENTAHCLRYHITRACGFVPSPSTVFCADLMIIEQMPSHRKAGQIV